MIIPSNQLINLPVYTQSGQHLGRVDAFEIDIDNHQITKYHIRTGLISGLWHQELIIDTSQVISISAEKMIVEDNTNKGSIADLAANPAVK